MKITFEYNQRENSYRVFQANNTNSIRIATIKGDKVSLTNEYKKCCFKQHKTEKEIKDTLLCEFQNYKFEQSPLRKLSRDQMQTLLDSLTAINTLSICFQDQITNIDFLKDVDVFDQVTSDLTELKDNLLKFTNKCSKTVGIDASIQLGDKADQINEVLNIKK